MNVLQSIDEGRFSDIVIAKKLSFNDIIKKLKDKYILTGSRAFGVNNEYSDYDIVCLEQMLVNMIKITNSIDWQFFSSSMYNKFNTISNCKYITKDNKIVNFLTYDNIKFIELFNEINSRMVEDMSIKDLSIKEKRYKHFEYLFEQVRLELSYIKKGK